ncbi:hypothetical protein ACWCQL_04340 [Streptomyces sp. NPDC002073]
MADEGEANTPIQSMYEQRFAADLEKNLSEQDHIVGQLAELQTRLDQLRSEETWLTRMQGAMPAPPVPQPASEEATAEAEDSAPASVPAPATGQVQAALPQPRQEEPTSTPAPAPAPAKTAAKKPIKKSVSKTPAAAGKAPTKTPAKRTPRPKATKATRTAKASSTTSTAPTPAPAPAPAAAKKTAKPTLGALVEVILNKRAGEPFKVSEVRTELGAAHPERSTSDQVVRNTLENLAKKGSIEKENQRGVVLFTKPATTAARRDTAAKTATAAPDAVPVEA